MRLTKREFILIYILSLVLVIYLFHTYLYTPLIASTQNIINENNELMAVTVLVSKLSDEESQKALDKKRQEFAEFNKKVPEDVYLPETIKEIEKMSQKNKVELIKTRYYLDDQDTNQLEEVSYKECFFEIELIGSYFNLTKFVKELEKAERLYTIDSIKMTANQAGTDTEDNADEVLMNLVFKCYYDNINWDDVKGKDKIVYKNEKTTDPFAVK